jgi:ribonuclease P protein component
MRRSGQFTTTVRSGRRGSSRALLVHVVVPAPGVSCAAAQVGFVVGRAVGPAVVRNRVRRRLRHLVRERLTRLPAGAAVVVRAHPVAATLSSSQLGAELDQALGRSLR